MSDTTTRAVMLYTRDATLWAVELQDGWIPTRAIKLEPSQAECDLNALDWAAAIPTPTWNAANMVPVCDARKRKLVSGEKMTTRLKTRVKPVAMPAIGIAQHVDLEGVKEAAKAAIVAEVRRVDAGEDPAPTPGV